MKKPQISLHLDIFCRQVMNLSTCPFPLYHRTQISRLTHRFGYCDDAKHVVVLLDRILRKFTSDV